MKPSQNYQILDHLEHGHCLDSMTALRKFGCARLAARVKELREVGYDIRTRLTMVHTKAGKARVAIYWLPPQEIKPTTPFDRSFDYSIGLPDRKRYG